MGQQKPWPTKGVEAIAAVVWLEARYQKMLRGKRYPELYPREMWMKAVAYVDTLHSAGAL